MSDAVVMDLARQAIIVGMMVTMPILAVALFMGLAVSVFQAVTQVQEMTLTYVPKLIGAAIVLLLLGNWMLMTLVNFANICFQHAASVGR